MNSKERVATALRGEIPDRAPLGFFAIDSDTASKILGRETYWRAKAKSQIAFWEGRRDEVVESWIADGIELYKKLDIIDVIPACCDAAGLCPPRDYAPDPPCKVDDNTWKDRDGRVYKYSAVTKDITMVHDPDTWTRSHSIEDELWDGRTVEPDPSVFEVVDALIEAFGNDRFILGPSGGENAWLLLGGMERGFMEIASRPEDVKQIFESRVAESETLDRYFIRPGQDGVLWGQDLAHQNAPMMSPESYRDLFLEGFKRRVAQVKKSGQAVVKHACGNNGPLLGMFAEAGIDCYQSIQASAGMDLVEIKKQYGDKFALWGGVPVEYLIEGSADDIRGAVCRAMTEVAPQGGFILGTSHSVAVGTRYENFMTLLDEFEEQV